MRLTSGMSVQATSQDRSRRWKASSACDFPSAARVTLRLLKLLASGEVHAACVLLPGDGDVLPAGLSAQRLMSELLAASCFLTTDAAPLAVLKGNRYAAQ
jgi:hypothetical protein